MKVVIIGPGLMPIPPFGWGAVESLIWEYKQTLERYYDISVTIVNTPLLNAIIDQTNSAKPDVVHIHYDDYWHLYDKFECKNVIITSHYAYISEESRLLSSGYMDKFIGFVKASNDPRNPAVIHALSSKIAAMYVKYGANPANIVVISNGANSDVFQYEENPLHPDRSICLAKIEHRKRQYLLQHISNLYFAGNIAPDAAFPSNHPRYLGQWSKDTLHKHLTDYGNLVLLSDGEAHPLVVCEALMAGLGVVVSEVASAHLDRSLPFISVIPDDRIHDMEYVQYVIDENRKISIAHRPQIREYALSNFSWLRVIQKYVSEILEHRFLQKNKCTLVTCYYRFPSKHSYDEYDQWMRNFLSTVESPIVIFSDQEMIPYIRTIRGSLPCTIIDMPLTKTYCSQFATYWERDYQRDVERSLHNPNLYIVWNEKSYFVKLAMQLNPYSSELYAWVDIGCFRDSSLMHHFRYWPHGQRLSSMKRGIMHLLQMKPFEPNDVMLLPNGLTRSFEYDIRISGTIMIGDRAAWRNWITRYYETLDLYMQNDYFAGKDQNVMATTIIKHPSIARLLLPSDARWNPWFYLHEYFTDF